jgi:peptide subunit release factor RF-3
MVECIGNSLIIPFQLFLPNDGSGAIAGVIGALRLDVLAGRLQAEYGLSVTLETTGSKRFAPSSSVRHGRRGHG